MASLLNLVNHVLLATEKARDFDQLLVTVEHAAEDFAADLAHRPAQIAKKALRLIPDGATVMTISSSSAVFAALQHAHEVGQIDQVICLESCPQREGVALARRLAEAGIDVSLAVDAAMGHFINRTDIVLLGADTISPQGWVNKIGTYALAVAADAHGVPAYALAGTDKFLPVSLLKSFKIEAQDPREVLDEAVPANLHVMNVYFEVVPLDWAAGVVTEHDVLTADKIVEQLNTIQVHSALLLKE
jgi:translation initiation factor 2B subunit (eIF-2B alpha/beta/delta family)